VIPASKKDVMPFSEKEMQVKIRFTTVFR